jgi:hypothetical protein
MKLIRIPVYSLVLGLFGAGLGWLVWRHLAIGGIGVLIGYVMWVNARLVAISEGQQSFNVGSVANIVLVTLFTFAAAVLLFTNWVGIDKGADWILWLAVVPTIIVVTVLHWKTAQQSAMLRVFPSPGKILDEFKP